MNRSSLAAKGDTPRYTTRPANRGAARGLRIELPVAAESPGRSRDAARNWCADCGLAQETCDTLLLLLSEVVTNAVLHSGCAETGIEVDASVVDHTVQVIVSDGGHGFVRPPRMASSAGGYGLFLLDTQATRWGTSGHDRTRVWFELDIMRPADDHVGRDLRLPL